MIRDYNKILDDEYILRLTDYLNSYGYKKVYYNESRFFKDHKKFYRNKIKYALI